MNYLFSILRKIESWLLIILMIALTITSFLQVVFRLVIGDPLAWSEEASRYLFVWATFLGSVLVLANAGHFNIDFIIDIFPDKAKRLFVYFSYFCIGIFAFILVKYGLLLQESASTQMTPALKLNMSWVYSIIPISGVLMIIHLIELIYNDLTKNIKSKGGDK